MTKVEILEEIKRIAANSGGAAPGMGKFEAETGIRRADWLGVYWRSWGEAVREAGLTPNAPPPRIEEEDLLTRYAGLARQLGHAPTKADLKLAKRRDQTFPSDTVLVRRFGSYPAVRNHAYEFCRRTPRFSDVAPLLETVKQVRTRAEPDRQGRPLTGFVYLLKHGTRAEYKIGMTSNPIRREGEIRLQLPEKLQPLHYIETDDPAGVEAYWHTRFAAKRKEGEWFALSREDVAAFRRWKRIV